MLLGIVGDGMVEVKIWEMTLKFSWERRLCLFIDFWE